MRVTVTTNEYLIIKEPVTRRIFWNSLKPGHKIRIIHNLVPGSSKLINITTGQIEWANIVTFNDILDKLEKNGLKYMEVKSENK